jgi:beta-glucanase (GH16 family)
MTTYTRRQLVVAVAVGVIGSSLAGYAVGSSTASSPDVIASSAVIASAEVEQPADTAGSTIAPVGPEGYELVFSSEFDESLGDEWSTCYWWQVDGGCTIETNGEQQWYRPEGVNVADGVVTLTAEEIDQTTTDGSTLPLRSGMISTGHVDNDVDDPGFAFTYGYVEARVRLPEADGTWPAVWLLSADRTSLPEIDIMEWYGSRPEAVTAHVHQRIDDERASQRIDLDVDDVAGEWHTVAVDWQEDHIEFFFDDVSMGIVDDADLIPDTPLYLIINLAMGGRAGDVDVDALPQTFAIDWIRVWQ